jgi:hypothetical protein
MESCRCLPLNPFLSPRCMRTLIVPAFILRYQTILLLVIQLLLFSFFSTDIKLCCCWQRAQGTGQKVKTTLKLPKIDSAIGVEPETQSSLSTQLIEVSKVVHTTRFRSIHPLICITGYNYLSLSRMSTNM